MNSPSTTATATAQPKGWTLQRKIFWAILLLPIVATLTYHLVAERLLISDKVAVVLDNALRITGSTAQAVAQELGAADQWALNRVPDVFGANPPAEFLRYGPARLRGVQFYAFDRTAKKYVRKFAEGLGADPSGGKEFGPEIEKMIARLVGRDLLVTTVSNTPTSSLLLMGRRPPASGLNEDRLVFTLYDATSLRQRFTKRQFLHHFLVGDDGTILLGPPGKAGSLREALGTVGTKFVLNNVLSDGSTDVVSPGGQRLVAAYARVPRSPLTVMVDADRDALLVGARLLTIKATLLCISILSLALLLSFLITERMTTDLIQIFDGLRRIGRGELDTSLKISSRDELGAIAAGINLLTAEVRRLISAGRDAARMEAELQTARLVQKSLFPKPAHCSTGQLELAGKYRTSTECGGDWWYHFQHEDELYVVIADATGHGTPAALITAVARSLFSKLEGAPQSLLEIAADWDRAVAISSDQEIMMTALLARINVKTGAGAWVNASHCDPFMVRPKDGKFHAESPVLANGSRLGELKRDWRETRFQMAPGERMLLVTDGVFDLTNANGRRLREIAFMRKLEDLAQEHASALKLVNSISDYLVDFSSGQDIPDDITLVVVERKPA